MRHLNICFDPFEEDDKFENAEEQEKWSKELKTGELVKKTKPQVSDWTQVRGSLPHWYLQLILLTLLHVNLGMI